MSEKQPWRPTLAPKPTPASLHPTSPQARDASPALRGASLAFTPHGGRAAAPPPGQNHNAALAAAAAGRARPQQTGSQGNGANTAVVPSRGRSQLTLDLDQAARKLQAAPSDAKPFERPTLSRNASEIAARAASNSTSPARTSGSAASRTSSPSKRFQQAISREASSIGQGRVGKGSEDGALQGANAAMTNSPGPASKSSLPENAGRLDIKTIPSLALSSSTSYFPPNQPANGFSTTAARTADAIAEPHGKEVPSAPRPIKPQPRGFQSTAQQPPAVLNQSSLPSGSESRSRTRASGDGLLATKSPTQHLMPMPIPEPHRGKTSPRPPGTPILSPREKAGMTANSLADAMVASSVASSRVQSPAPPSRRPKPPPIPYRRSMSLNAREHKAVRDNPPLKPMPIRPMRQTMRKQSPKGDDDDDAKRGRKHLLRKHPNMHHEGDRKRWRDKVTEGERRRYEGVWAANRGLWHEHETTDLVRLQTRGTNSEDMVINVVVKDIWNRSRLPRDVLEEIWDLVTDEDSKALNRWEFVVGMWLIDQWLKGRKLPSGKVSPSVWNSVRHTRGVKIRNKPL